MSRVISGVYQDDAGNRKVMTRKEFKTKLRLRGGGKSSAGVTHWRKVRRNEAKRNAEVRGGER